VSSGGLDDLGFTGLLLAGLTPEQAWAEVHRTSQEPEVQAIIAELAASPEGREALDWSRAQWADHGLPPPWEAP
jgi:hypothetical protein